MSRFSMRRTASVVAATALVAGGMSLGAGTAAAAPEGSCDTNNLTVSKKVLNDGEVAPGGEVRVRTVFSVTGHPERFLNKLVDVHPAGFSYVRGTATVDAWTLLSGQKTKDVEPSVQASANTITVSDAGYLLSSTGNKTVTFEATYLAPKDAKVGAEHAFGSKFDVSLFETTQVCDDMATVKIREKNIVEGATSGSADLGFGSADTEGGSGSAGSSVITDPAGFIGSIIGSALKSAS